MYMPVWGTLLRSVYVYACLLVLTYIYTRTNASNGGVSLCKNCSYLEAPSPRLLWILKDSSFTSTSYLLHALAKNIDHVVAKPSGDC